MNDKNHDNEMVKVNLDVQRMYRVNHEDKEAITVGPGEAMVPSWVKAHWEESSKPAPPTVNLEPPVSATERAEFQQRIAALLDELQAVRAKLADTQEALTEVEEQRDSYRSQLENPRLEPKPERDALPRGVPRTEQKITNGGKKVN